VTIWLRTCLPELRLKQSNGRESVYIRPAAPQKPIMKRSQRHRRIAIGSRLFSAVVGAPTDVAGARAAAKTARPTAIPTSGFQVGKAAPNTLSLEQQLGLIEGTGMSFTAFNGIGRGKSQAGLASLPVLREARQRLAGLPAKRVTVTPTGAHLVSFKDAVTEKLNALWASKGFAERLIRDHDLNRIPQTREYEPPATEAVGSAAASPPPDVKDVQITLGPDKGGAPSSVKVVLGICNQERPHKLLAHHNGHYLAAAMTCSPADYILSRAHMRATLRLRAGRDAAHRGEGAPSALSRGGIHWPRVPRYRREQ